MSKCLQNFTHFKINNEELLRNVQCIWNTFSNVFDKAAHRDNS